MFSLNKFKDYWQRLPNWGSHLLVFGLGLSLSVGKRQLPKSDWVGLIYTLEGSQKTAVKDQLGRSQFLLDKKAKCLFKESPIYVAKVAGTTSLVFSKSATSLPLIKLLLKKRLQITANQDDYPPCLPQGRSVTYG